VRLVAEAQRGRTHMQRLADRVAAVFTPIVVAVAAVVFASWLASGRVDATEKATRAAVAVLVVACPCALGLATPTVVLVASGLAALRGILVRNAASLERLGQVRLVVWDKTGTLTNGRPMVDSVTCFVNDEVSDDEMVRLAASAEMFAAHPLARAIVSCARRRGIGLTEPSTFASSPGGGVRALVENRVVLVGSMTFIAQNGVETGWLESAASGASREGHSVAAVAVDGQPVGLIFFKDAIRPSAAEAIRRLRRLGIRSVMLTGDREVTARAVAAELGIEDVYAEATPEQKVEYVHDLKEQRASARAALRTPMVFREPRGLKLSASCRSRDGLVAMVGDGVNDAAALSAADVGIAFATGADVAVEAAEINLIGSTPHLVADAVELSRSSVRVIRQNLFWAFAYNVLMIPLAAVGVVPPWMAAGAMMLSSLTVVGNALRLPRVVGWSTAQVQAPGKHVMNI
jgi:Cu+-exporting ATPase